MGKWNEILKAAWNGLSEFINETSAGIVILLFNIILMRNMGPMGVAAFTMIGYVSLMGGLICYGFADALTPLVSVNNGAGKHARSREFLRCMLFLVCLIDLLLLIFLSYWPQIIIDLFLMNAPEATDIALEFVRASRWAFLFIGINIALTSYFTGRLWAAASFTTAFCRGLFFPCLLLAILPAFMGINGVFYVLPMAEGLTCCAAIAIYKYCSGKTQQSDR